MDFTVFPWRFSFVARESIRFPAGSAGNVLRGGFGTVFRRVACDPSCPGVRQCERRDSCSYAQIFEPGAGVEGGPSGLANRPRPFVFRASHLDGRLIPAGGRFHFDVHVFLRDEAAGTPLAAVFHELGREGFGAARGRADMEPVPRPKQVILPVDAGSQTAERLRIRFLTPTDLKAEDGRASQPHFRVVFGRARDRVATLSALYGAGPLPLDFRTLGQRAEAIRMTHCDVRRIESERRSSRTGQSHSLGGFAGEARYEGGLAEFLPILKVAEWTGIGRHTVWGNGQIWCD